MFSVCTFYCDLIFVSAYFFSCGSPVSPLLYKCSHQVTISSIRVSEFHDPGPVFRLISFFGMFSAVGGRVLTVSFLSIGQIFSFTLISNENETIKTCQNFAHFSMM